MYINADVLISAVGKPNLVNANMVKPDALVIDGGISYINNSNRHNKLKVVGDVDFDSVVEKAGYLTPVPGGVGPLTVVMLMKNVVEAWKRMNIDQICETH